MKNYNYKTSRLKLFLPVFFVLFCIKLLMVDFMRIQGCSMEPTLQQGQIICINRMAYGFQLPFFNVYLINWKKEKRGDIIVYKNPADVNYLVKRCIGIEGDNILVNNGVLEINNIKIPISFINSESINNLEKIPINTVFTAGDNFFKSIDSRCHGFIPINNITGKVISIPFSGNNND